MGIKSKSTRSLVYRAPKLAVSGYLVLLAVVLSVIFLPKDSIWTIVTLSILGCLLVAITILGRRVK